MQKVAGDPGVCISAWDPPPRPPFSCPPVCAIRANCRSADRPPMVPARYAHAFAHSRQLLRRQQGTATGDNSDSGDSGERQRQRQQGTTAAHRITGQDCIASARSI